MNDYSKGLENLRKQLRLARQVLRSDRAYSRALDAEHERDWLHWCRTQNRALDSVINAAHAAKRRRRRRKGDLNQNNSDLPHRPTDNPVAGSHCGNPWTEEPPCPA